MSQPATYPLLTGIERLGPHQPLPIANETYAGHRLLYHQRSEAAFFETADFAAVRRRVWAAVWFSAFVSFLTIAVGIPLALLAPSLSSPLLAIVVLVAVVGFVFCFFIKEFTGISSWQGIADGMGSELAEVVRRTAVDLNESRRLAEAGIHVEESKDAKGKGRRILHCSSGTFHIYATFVAVGNDLHIGWTMVNAQTGPNVAWEFVSTYALDWLEIELRNAAPRAMREAVHNSIANAMTACFEERSREEALSRDGGSGMVGAGVRSS